MVNYIFNPGSEDFEIFLKNKIFVDKTELIYHLNNVINSPDRFICVSRPRRFGKTTNANMLSAYYSFLRKKKNRIKIFNDKEIAKFNEWDKYLGKLNVIKLTMTDFFTKNTVEDGLKEIMQKIVTEVKNNKPEIEFKNENDIVSIFEEIRNLTDKKIVLIIDEWDIILREKRNEEVKEYLKFLNKATKDKNYIALAYITGILPIKKYGIQSSLDFDEYTMISSSWMTKFIGFTQKEVKSLCKKLQVENDKLNKSHTRKYKKRKLNEEYNNKEEIINCKETLQPEELTHKNILTCNKINSNNKLNNIQKQKMQKKRRNNKKSINEIENEVNFKNMKKWYNGYRLYDEIKKKIYRVYTPFSIVKSIKMKEISNYWNRTETFFALSEYIEMDLFGLKEDIIRLRNGKKIKIEIESYQNDMSSFKKKDDVLTMLIHLGYLGYDIKTKEVFIPNKEVLKEFITITDSENWNIIVKKLERSKELLKATWNQDFKKVAELIEEFHDETSNMDYNNESALKYTILLGYYVSDKYYNSFLELDSGKGFIDIAYIPYNLYSKYPALIIELKYEKNVETAMDQIKKRNYPQKLKEYKGNILLVGINYNKEISSNSEEFKHHTCTIEEFKK